MDLEHFITNRTMWKPSSVFKALGDAAKSYGSTTDTDIVRLANIPFRSSNDIFDKIKDLSSSKLQTMCTASVYNKSKRFEYLKL